MVRVSIRSRGWARAGLVWLVCASAAHAQDGLAPVGGPGRSGARAGAGVAAGGDAFAVTRNPAALARVRDSGAAIGALATGTMLEPRHTLARRERHALGGVAVALSWSVGARAVRGWRDPFTVPLRARVSLLPQAGAAADPLQGEGRIALTLDTAPRLIEVRARGPLAEISDVRCSVEPLGGAAPVAEEAAPGGALFVADYTSVLRWSEPLWSTGRGALIVRYRWRFEPLADGAVPEPGSRIEVRLDVDGQERERAVHPRPEPPTGGQPDGDPGIAPVGGTGADGPLDAPLGDAPSSDVVRALEAGGWRVGVALAPTSVVASGMDAPGLPGGYGLRHLVETATVGFARHVGERVSIGVSAQVYASAVTGLELPVTMPDGFGGTQSASLRIDRAVTAGFGGSAGVLWDASDTLTFGLHYQSAAAMGSQRGTAEISGLTTFGGVQGATTGEWDVAVRNLGVPQRAGASAAWRPFGDVLLLAADLTWWDWSSELNDIRLLLEEPDGPGFQATGATVYRIRIPMNWEDRFSAAVGFTWRAWPQLLLHGGYAYGRNPYPAGAVHPLIPAIIRHHVAAGVTVQLGRLTADVGVTAGLPDAARLEAPGVNNARLRVWSLTGQVTVGWRF